MGNYDDIIDMPHHVSSKRAHMSLHDRAAQFAPFAALNGHGDAIDETARLTDGEIELAEDELDFLNYKLKKVMEIIADRPAVTITCFKPDERKSGGKYITVKGNLKKVDLLSREIILENEKIVELDKIIDIVYN